MGPAGTEESRSTPTLENRPKQPMQLMMQYTSGRRGPRPAGWGGTERSFRAAASPGLLLAGADGAQGWSLGPGTRGERGVGWRKAWLRRGSVCGTGSSEAKAATKVKSRRPGRGQALPPSAPAPSADCREREQVGCGDEGMARDNSIVNALGECSRDPRIIESQSMLWEAPGAEASRPGYRSRREDPVGASHRASC